MQKSPISTSAASTRGTSAWDGSAPQYPLESVDNALKILLFFEDKPDIRLTEASEYLGVASSTAHRLLAMLRYRGFVRQDPQTKAYRPGPSLANISFKILAQFDVRRQARPLLESLNQELRETVHLGLLNGTMVTFLDGIESPKAVRIGSRMGTTMPAHCTSMGKAMLADLSHDELLALYPNEKLEKVTPLSIGFRSELEKELAKVRRAGYATNREEGEEGVCSVAIALPSGFSNVRVAVNVAIPATGTTPAALRRLGAKLVAASEAAGLRS